MKRILFSVLAGMLVISLTATADAASKKRFISIGTGGPTGVYFQVATPFAVWFTRKQPKAVKRAANMESAVRRLPLAVRTTISARSKKASLILALPSLIGSITPITGLAPGRASSSRKSARFSPFILSPCILLLVRKQASPDGIA